MAQDTHAASPPDILFAPQVRLDGRVNDEMLRSFIDQLRAAEGGQGALAVELTTTGGDAETARRIAGDLRLFRERTGRTVLFFGKAVVYSAGVTILAAVPREHRWLTRGTSLLIHSRTINLTLNLEGPLATERRKLKQAIAQIDEGLRLQKEGFRELVAGSNLTEEEFARRARRSWYVSATEALARGLVAGVV